jgi:hypothetical protein
LPLITIATAIPRLRVNQSETSATRGTNVAEVPSSPISSPWAAENCTRFCDTPAATKPRARQIEPMSTGTRTPNRSASFPMRMPPMPNPIMVSV